jgi:hypothetical protein
VIESLIDLTYRGISLGRRIKLTQIRPTTGYVELPTPMPVGTELVIGTDEAISFGAIVTWVHEQVAGTDRIPGMIVQPRLSADVTAWWQARITLADDDAVRPSLPRTRPVTVRPRSHTQQSQPIGAPTAMPAIIADLDARVAAAARSSQSTDPRTRSDPDAATHRTGQHEVVDDGAQTLIMEVMDDDALGPEAGDAPRKPPQ